MNARPKRIADITRAIARDSADIESVVVLEDPVEFLEVTENHAISPIAFGFNRKTNTEWGIDKEVDTALELGTPPIVKVESDEVFPERYIAEDSNPVWIELS